MSEQDKRNDNLNHEDLIKNLERINFWIINCDTKISFALVLSGVLMTIFFTSSFITGAVENLFTLLINISKGNDFEFKSLIAIITLMVFLSLIFTIGNAIIIFIKALTATIDTKFTKQAGLTNNSLLFFGSIANSSFKQFKINMKDATQETLDNDLLSQIYLNSHICTNKFKIYNQGLTLLKDAVILFLILNVLFLLCK